MKIVMLSTQQESATGPTYQQGTEYELPLEQAQAFVSYGWAKEVEPVPTPALQTGQPAAPTIIKPVPPPPVLRSDADLSKPLNTQAVPCDNDDTPITFPTKTVIVSVPQKSGIQREQTVVVKHHDSVKDILTFLRQPTDGSVEMLRPDTQVPFALEDYPYAYLFVNEKIALKNHALLPTVASVPAPVAAAAK